MRETHNDPIQNLSWRRLYTDAALVWTLLDILSERKSQPIKNENFWTEAVGRLDHSIVIAGAPGEGRLDLVLDTIEQIQIVYLARNHSPFDTNLPVPPGQDTARDDPQISGACLPVPVLSSPPSVSAFRAAHSRTPFILRRFANDWPAICRRKWASKSYLHNAAGRGRIVPVEIGRDYRTEDWTQRMMGWDEFLDYLFSDTDSNENPDLDKIDQTKVLYLAQYDLFKQFHSLRRDIVIPDYIYASLSPPDHYPQYRPPANDEELVLNAWFGPRDTISPAHTDPYFNLYTQVVGRKTVWLAPPSVSDILSPVSESLNSGVSSPPLLQHHNPTEIGTTNSMLSNTSQLDVFAPTSDLQKEPKFLQKVVPVAMSAVLEEGDMLFFPPGWWHAFRSETPSFSVSMWF
ncbi:Clavaminate synthase-like protein [Fomitiporia mediterranea MF3/22]|uniref:Clavaminate synthase-like protein n=1 Tax=Fomitiporia mediterranea (strain MF3/22) TaxID=694068 RepID=UPI00044093FF|nr:Clavaminate synthase-like protein [Fomitiporia mediterranea MF3/22]EJD06078.1 Clavaminate synthase-like protein [Fomitiporia mediterranea MF3/22]